MDSVIMIWLKAMLKGFRNYRGLPLMSRYRAKFYRNIITGNLQEAETLSEHTILKKNEYDVFDNI